MAQFRQRDGVGGRGVTSPIEGYLAELERKLPMPNPRITEEIEAHLAEAKEHALRAGLSSEEAEREAVMGMGTVDDVVASVRSEGTPQLSPFLVQIAPLVAAIFALPALIFVMVNLIEVAAGNEGGFGVFGDSLEPWEREVNMLLTLGPIVAFLVLLLTHSHIRIARVARGFEASVQLRLRGLALGLVLLAVGLILGVVGYLFAEDVFCTMETFPIC